MLNIPNKNIRRVSATREQHFLLLPRRLEFSPCRKVRLPCFEGGKGSGKGQFDSPTGIAVDGSGNVLVADTGNGRIEKFSPTGAFLSIIGTKGVAKDNLPSRMGSPSIASGNIYVADAGQSSCVRN